MMNKINYMRQEELFNPTNQRFKIIVLGVGSLGSLITLNLAKLGFNDIEVWDYDRVEVHNIPNQFYRMKDIGRYKVDSLFDIIKEFTDVDIDKKVKKVNKDTIFNVNMETLFILTFDTLENRKMFFNLIKGIKCDVLDVRCGGEEYNIQVINTFNDEDMSKWERSFNIIPTNLPCGARSIIYTNLSVASEVSNIIKKMNNGEEYPKKLIRHMKEYLILNDLKVK